MHRAQLFEAPLAAVYCRPAPLPQPSAPLSPPMRGPPAVPVLAREEGGAKGDGGDISGTLADLMRRERGAA